MEEIYPPKLSTFAYVTDGACTEQEILDMEIVVMTTLKWKLTPITPASWVNVFLQILSVTPQRVNCLHFLRSRAIRLNLTPPEPEDMHLVAPNYAGIDYVRALRIIDLTILDLQSFQFSYSALAASSIYHTKGKFRLLEYFDLLLRELWSKSFKFEVKVATYVMFTILFSCL